MAYHGYTPLLKKQLYELKHPPRLLEVGVDRGVMFMTLVTFLVRTKESFIALGVDVLIQEQVKIMLHYLDRTEKHQAFLTQENSLEVLPKLVEQGMMFDALLIDGDHNYYTVSKELTHLEKLTAPGGIVLVDDYNGRWSERDLFYADREDYKGVTGTTKPVDTEKHGVKPAVDEWLLANPTWEALIPVQGEPVLLRRR